MKQIDESWYVKADARAKKEYDKFENNDNDSIDFNSFVSKYKSQQENKNSLDEDNDLLPF